MFSSLLQAVVVVRLYITTETRAPTPLQVTIIQLLAMPSISKSAGSLILHKNIEMIVMESQFELSSNFNPSLRSCRIHGWRDGKQAKLNIIKKSINMSKVFGLTERYKPIRRETTRIVASYEKEQYDEKNSTWYEVYFNKIDHPFVTFDDIKDAILSDINA